MSNSPGGGLELPIELSNMVAAITAAGSAYDLAISGIPFTIKASDQFPLLRQLVPDKKDSFDNSQQAGEQSFGYWWQRSQSSFHGGAGQLFLDSGTQDSEISRIRYWDSLGLDVTEPGSVTVRPAWTASSPSVGVAGHVRACGVVRSAVSYVAALRDDTNKVDLYNVNSWASSQLTLSGANPGADMCTDGSRLFVAENDKVVKYNHDSSTPVTVATLTFSGPVRIGWAKSRLILTNGAAVYEVDPNGSSVALTTPEFTHPNSGWRWTCIADGPNGIYLTGYAGAASQLYSMTEAESGGTLVLGPATVQASMPLGEIINTVFFYVNSTFVLGTTEGARVGIFTPYGQPVYGPASSPGVSVQEITAVGTTAILGTSTGLVALDLGTPVDAAGRYAFSPWAERTGVDDSAYVGIVAVQDTAGDIQVFPVTVDYVYRENADETSGTLTSSWITFTTTEPKRTHFATVTGSFPNAPVVADHAVSITIENREGGTVTHNITGGAGTATTFELGVVLDSSSAYRFTVVLTDDPSNPSANTLSSVQLKALPEARRYQALSYPLMCFDRELRSDGIKRGYVGFAKDRLVALEDLARSNTVVTVEDRLLNETYQAQIMDVQFRQDQGLEKTSRLGGMLTVILSLVS